MNNLNYKMRMVQKRSSKKGKEETPLLNLKKKGQRQKNKENPKKKMKELDQEIRKIAQLNHQFLILTKKKYLKKESLVYVLKEINCIEML